ncbi:hypothetical protein [Paraglaciecola sp.]|uniref:hypothetical protein n=1 Tax=Paraglaciecola sp. TaxID=1920173 RepID=UPI003EF95236
MAIKLKVVILIHCLIINATSPAIAEESITELTTLFGIDSYRGKLLQHALSYSATDTYKFKKLDVSLPTVRAYNLMAENAGIDVMSGTSTAVRESKHLAIKFPIYKGLNGWRIPIINKKNKDLLADITNSKALKKLVAGQLLLWTDTKILQANDIPVSTGQFYALFQMLDKQRLHYIPQSALNANRNVETYHNLNIMLDPNLVIKYPTAVYYYVNKDNIKLAADIESGLNRALKDGSFDRLFNQYYAADLAKLNLAKRKIITLHNPFLVEGTPLQKTELWHSVVSQH